MAVIFHVIYIYMYVYTLYNAQRNSCEKEVDACVLLGFDSRFRSCRQNYGRHRYRLRVSVDEESSSSW